MTMYYHNAGDEERWPVKSLEVFYVNETEVLYNLQNMDHADEYTITKAGWYYWSCYPGCLPDTEATGPFETEVGALGEARLLYHYWS